MKAAPADSRDGFQNASQKLLSFERDLPEIAIQDDLSVFHLVLPFTFHVPTLTSYSPTKTQHTSQTIMNNIVKLKQPSAKQQLTNLDSR